MPTPGVASGPPPDFRRPLWVLAAAGMQLAFLVWAARARHTRRPFPARSAIPPTTTPRRPRSPNRGLLFFNPYDGYRSYFVPFFISCIQRLAMAAGFDGSAVAGYAYGVSLVFWLVSAGLMWWLAHRVGARTFWTTSIATLLNPILLVYVPFALQEGVLMACCLPLLFVWTGAKDLDPARRATLVMMMAIVAYIIRSSLMWWVPLAAIYSGGCCDEAPASSPLAAMDGCRRPRRLPSHRTPGLHFQAQIRLFQSLSVDHAACPADRLGHNAPQVRNDRGRRHWARAHVLVAVRGGAGRG
jgi:hypothetical protein